MKYQKVRNLVALTLDLSPTEARNWLMEYANLKLEGRGIHRKVHWDGDTELIFDKLLGPHGIALIHVLNIRKKP